MELKPYILASETAQQAKVLASQADNLSSISSSYGGNDSRALSSYLQTEHTVPAGLPVCMSRLSLMWTQACYK